MAEILSLDACEALPPKPSRSTRISAVVGAGLLLIGGVPGAINLFRVFAELVAAVVGPLGWFRGTVDTVAPAIALQVVCAIFALPGWYMWRESRKAIRRYDEYAGTSMLDESSLPGIGIVLVAFGGAWGAWAWSSSENRVLGGLLAGVLGGGVGIGCKRLLSRFAVRADRDSRREHKYQGTAKRLLCFIAVGATVGAASSSDSTTGNPALGALAAGFVGAIMGYGIHKLPLETRDREIAFDRSTRVSHAALTGLAAFTIVAANCLLWNMVGLLGSRIDGRMAGKGPADWKPRPEKTHPYLVGLDAAEQRKSWHAETERSNQQKKSLWAYVPTLPSFWLAGAERTHSGMRHDIDDAIAKQETVLKRAEELQGAEVAALKSGLLGWAISAHGEWEKTLAKVDPDRIHELGNKYFIVVESNCRIRAVVASACLFVFAAVGFWMIRNWVRRRALSAFLNDQDTSDY